MLLYFYSCEKEDNPCGDLVLCGMFCENGYFLDENGCELCECIIYGCIDSEAINYNPNANIDDESCLYP